MRRPGYLRGLEGMNGLGAFGRHGARRGHRRGGRGRGWGRGLPWNNYAPPVVINDCAVGSHRECQCVPDAPSIIVVNKT